MTELLLAGAAVTETLTPDEVCCWQGSPSGGPLRKQNRGSKIGKQNKKAKSGSRRGDYFKKLLPFEIFILNCRLEFSKNLKR